MKHLSQSDLIMQYYGEGGAAVPKHLAECGECRMSFERLSSELSAITLPQPPARPEDYGAEVWRKLRNQLPEHVAAVPWWAVPRRWAAVVTVAVLFAVAFLAGRYTGREPMKPMEATNDSQLPQKVLVVALGDYLDRSEMLLVEVAHATSPEDLDFNTQRRYASELIATNRLYRQTAQRVGDAGTDALLDQLERVLLQVAHTPEGATAADIQQLRHEIETGGLLFKVRVAQVHMKSEAKPRNASKAGQDEKPII